MLLGDAPTGFPVVAIQIDSCREVIANGANGYRLPLRNQDITAKVIDLLACNQRRRRKVARNKSELVESGFEIWDMANRLANIMRGPVSQNFGIRRPGTMAYVLVKFRFCSIHVWNIKTDQIRDE